MNKAQALAFAVSFFSLPLSASTFDAIRQQMTAPSGAFLNRLFDNSGAVPAGTDPQFQELTLPSGQPMSQAQLKGAMVQYLDTIQSAFSAQYAPGQWKQGHEGWNLDAAIAQAKKQVQDSPNIDINQYHDVLRSFFKSMKDYHVSVSFDSTETSSLPFTVVGTGGHYYIAFIDRNKLSETSFPFHEGDELVSFGGVKTADAVKAIQDKLGGNVEATDRAIAAMVLTSRKGSSFGGAQQGPISVSVKPSGSDKTYTRQLIWDYSPELVSQPKPRNDFGVMSFDGTTGGYKIPMSWTTNMLSPMQAALSGPNAANPFSLGARQSYLPDFGKKIWTSEDDAAFYAYEYKNADGKTIGYVRIPSYEPEDAKAAVKEFGALVKKFQTETDGLVIDQVNNPGGSVFYLYALASLLSEEPLTTPHHRIAITQDDVVEASQFLKLEAAIKNDASAQLALGASQDGYPVTYEFFRHMVEYFRFITNQWSQGKTLTDPTFLYGVDSINPMPGGQYTKPILLLVNELDFSGGDFFPAIMQDNKRATLFGTRTAGAGGFIREVKYPNQMGVNQFVMTGSIAIRSNKKPIENLGVTADVQYQPTAADYQGGFKDYAKAADAALAKLLQK